MPRHSLPFTPHKRIVIQKNKGVSSKLPACQTSTSLAAGLKSALPCKARGPFFASPVTDLLCTFRCPQRITAATGNKLNMVVCHRKYMKRSTAPPLASPLGEPGGIRAQYAAKMKEYLSADHAEASVIGQCSMRISSIAACRWPGSASINCERSGSYCN